MHPGIESERGLIPGAKPPDGVELHLCQRVIPHRGVHGRSQQEGLCGPRTVTEIPGTDHTGQGIVAKSVRNLGQGVSRQRSHQQNVGPIWWTERRLVSSEGDGESGTAADWNKIEQNRFEIRKGREI